MEKISHAENSFCSFIVRWYWTESCCETVKENIKKKKGKVKERKGEL